MRVEPLKASEGAPEWMVSYADMITIMMAFFVVMYALSGRKDDAAVQPVLTSLKQQFGPAWPFANLVPGDQRPRSELNKFKMNGQPSADPGRGGSAETDPQQRQQRSVRPGDGLVRGGIVYFDEFSANLTEKLQRQLQRVCADIAGKPQKIEIRGHSSRRALPDGSPYHDEWDLAFARCRQVMNYLVAQGIDRQRLRISAAGSNEPLPSVPRELITRGAARVEIYMLNEFVDEPAN